MMQQISNGAAGLPAARACPPLAERRWQGTMGVPSREEIDSLLALAKILAQSGVFPDARSAERAFAKLMFGRDLGLSPSAAMTGVRLVEGRPELSADLQAQLVRSYVGPGGERCDYRVTSPMAQRHERCEIEIARRWPDGRREALGRCEFTLADARRAGLLGRATWRAYPANMLFARAISNAVAFHCPEVTRGVRVYAEGEIAEAEAQQPQAASQQAPIASREIHEDAGQSGQAQQEAAPAGQGGEAGLSEHAAAVLAAAHDAGLPDAVLAAILRAAAGAGSVAPERAAAQLPMMLRRLPAQIAERALELIAAQDYAAFEPEAQA